MTEVILINGLIYGGVYAVLAVGFSLIFGVARILNMAHTAFYMLSAFIIFTFFSAFGLSVYLAAFLSLIVTTLLGVGTYKLFLERVREHETTVLLITVAIAMVIQEVLILIYGARALAVPAFLEGFQDVLGVRVLNQQLITFGLVFIILAIIWVVLSRTKLGIAIRATAQNREAANLMGINVGRTCLITMAISIAIATLCGAAIAPMLAILPTMWMHPLIMVLGIVIIGGLGSIRGSVIAAFMLGFVEVLVIFLMPMGAYLKTVVAMVAMVIVLLIKPEGLFGVVFEGERL